MIRRSGIGSICSKIVSLVLLLGTFSVAQAASQSPNVYLQVNRAGSALEVFSGTDTNTCDASTIGADNPRAPGYICFRKGNSGLINLHLPTSGSCHEQETGWNWHITEVLVGGQGSGTKPATWGGLSSGAAADLGVDPTTGVVDITPDSGSVVHFKNDNVHEFVYWYNVKAVCTRGEQTHGDPIYLDPRGRNGGTD